MKHLLHYYNMRLEEYFKCTRPGQQVDNIEIINHGLGGDYKIVFVNYGSDGYATYATAPGGSLLGQWMISTMEEYYPFKKWVNSVFTHSYSHWVFATRDGNNLVPIGMEDIQLNLETDYRILARLSNNQIVLCRTKQFYKYTKKSCVDGIYVTPMCKVPNDVMKAIIYYERYNINLTHDDPNRHYKPKLLGQYLCYGAMQNPMRMMGEIYPEFTGVYADLPRNCDWPEKYDMRYDFMIIHNCSAVGYALAFKGPGFISADVVKNIRRAISKE